MIAPPSKSAPPESAIVVGGGLAGISAALRLAERGVRATLFETRRKLGGRATSFTDVRTGEILDNCQHVALGCCTNYLDLCARLGVSDLLRWTEELHFLEPGGRRSTLSPTLLPAPAHLGPSFLTASFLNAADKAGVARGILAILRADRAKWTRRTFEEFLRETGQTQRAIERFWAPVVISACNLDVERVAASSALHVFQEGFLARRDAAAMAVAAVPLLRLYDPAEAAIRRAGGAIRLGASVTRVTANSIRTADGEEISADVVICTVPPERAAKIVDPEVQASDERFAHLERITHSPILGVHLVFDRPVMDLPHAVLVDQGTQWLFRKDEEGRKVHAVISAAEEWMALDEEEIGARVLADIRACIPAAREARLESVRAVKEKRATFAPTPEVEAIRPGTTGSSGLILAGCYVRTGWPATMEGAVRSGYLAAAAALGEGEAWALRPSLRPAAIPRLLAPGATAAG